MNRGRVFERLGGMPGRTGEYFLRQRRIPEPSVRLLCFAHAGGSAIEFVSWQAEMPVGVEVAGVELPGRGTRIAEPPIAAMPTLMDSLASAVEPLLDRPVALFGHSLGALVAFEFARVLRRMGTSPVMLFASGRPAPRVPYRERPLHTLPDDELVIELRRMNGTPAELLHDRGFREVYLPWLRVDLALNETYRYREEHPLTCPITALRGCDDELTPPGAMSDWRHETISGFEMASFAGDHFFTRTSKALVLRAIGWRLSASSESQIHGGPHP